MTSTLENGVQPDYSEAFVSQEEREAVPYRQEVATGVLSEGHQPNFVRRAVHFLVAHLQDPSVPEHGGHASKRNDPTFRGDPRG